MMERIKRGWFYWRMGHGADGIFILSFFNFVVITYILFVERFEFLLALFPYFYIFVVIFSLRIFRCLLSWGVFM